MSTIEYYVKGFGWKQHLRLCASASRHWGCL